MSVETAAPHTDDRPGYGQAKVAASTSIRTPRQDLCIEPGRYPGTHIQQQQQPLYMTQGINIVGQTFLDQVRYHHPPRQMHATLHWHKDMNEGQRVQVAQSNGYLPQTTTTHNPHEYRIDESIRDRPVAEVKDKPSDNHFFTSSDKRGKTELHRKIDRLRAELKEKNGNLMQRSTSQAKSNSKGRESVSQETKVLNGALIDYAPQHAGSIGHGRGPAAPNTLEELMRLRTLCQDLTHENAVQHARIHSFEQLQKSTTDLGAQWNAFHHSQMHRQAAMFRAYLDAKDLEAKNVQHVLEGSVARLVTVNDELQARLRSVGVQEGTTSSTFCCTGLMFAEEPKDIPHAILKRKALDTLGIPVVSVEASPTDFASTITEGAIPIPLSRFGTPVTRTQTPIKLVDGILPLPIPSGLEKLESPGKFLEPRIAEIRESPDPPAHKKRKPLPKIELSP